jgi:hypothetical protein
MISTATTYRFTYGYTEVRAKAPLEAGKGLWPAFWTLASGWPPEFDVIEVWTSEPRIHQGYCSHRPQGGERWDSFHSKAAPMGFHRYGMEWGPGYVFFNTDGKVTKRVYGPHVTDLPQYLILNSGVCSGKGSPAPDAATVFPNSFDVQYCRVYQRPQSGAVLNGGFEYDELAPWNAWGSVVLASGQAHSGNVAMRVAAEATAEQTLYGLLPGTEYELTAWVQLDDAKDEALFGVKGYGGDQKVMSATGSAFAGRFAPVRVRFRTGPKDTSAVVFCYRPSAGHAALFDDISLARPEAAPQPPTR